MFKIIKESDKIQFMKDYTIICFWDTVNVLPVYLACTVFGHFGGN